MPEPQHSPSHVSGRSERLPTAGSHRPRTAQIDLAWRCVWKACRSVDQGLEHDGIRDATGTEVSESAQERAIPEPQHAPSHVSSRSERLPTAGSHRPRTAHMPLDGAIPHKALCFTRR